MSSPITTPELMRQQNRAVILETIQERGPISRVDLARLLKLNPATVTRITRVLLEEDLICETGEGTTLGAGRKPTLLNFNHRARLLLGVHMGARGTTGVIADMAGAVLARRTILPGGTVSALVEELLSTDPSYTRRLVAGCLSASHPGLITDEMCRALHTELSIPIFAADDAELSARGEAEWGAARDQSFFALLYLGQHSRSVSYLDGYLRVGGLGFDAQGWPLAQQLSDQSVIDATRHLLLADSSSALHELPRLSVARIFEAARQHDPLALDMVRRIGQGVATSTLYMADMLALSHVVLGGTWHNAADLIIPAAYEQMQLFQTQVPVLVPADLGDDAPLMGAVRLALEHTSVRS